MIDSGVTRDRQKENSLAVAFEKAADRLRELDPSPVCRRSGAAFRGNEYIVPFAGEEYGIAFPSIDFTGEAPVLIVQVMILHYLSGEDLNPDSGEWTTFSSIKGAMFYAESFRRRVLNKLIRLFGDSPETLLPAGEKIGGTASSQSEYAVRIPLLPRIECLLKIYPEDDEFPVSASFLFSGNVADYLPVEDIAFLGGYVVDSLGRALEEIPL